jgi:hypothetical protein
MTKYMKFETEDGEFFVQVDETALPEEEGITEFGVGDSVKKKIEEVSETVKGSFEDALKIIKTQGTAFSKVVKSFEEEHRPDETQLTFGLIATGEIGTPFTIAKAGVAAGYAVTFIWRKDPTQSSDAVKTNIVMQPDNPVQPDSVV